MKNKILGISTIVLLALMASSIFVALPAKANENHQYNCMFSSEPSYTTGLFGTLNLQEIPLVNEGDYTVALGEYTDNWGYRIYIGLVCHYNGNYWNQQRIFVKYYDANGNGYWAYDSPLSSLGNNVQVGFGKSENDWLCYYNIGYGWQQFYTVHFGANVNMVSSEVEYWSNSQPASNNALFAYAVGIYYQTDGWSWHFNDWYEMGRYGPINYWYVSPNNWVTGTSIYTTNPDY